jgi:hypothetical protein
MEKWKYKSLAWIHKAREDNYKKTQDISPEQLVEKTKNATDDTIRSLGLKVVRPKENVRAH